MAGLRLTLVVALLTGAVPEGGGALESRHDPNDTHHNHLEEHHGLQEVPHNSHKPHEPRNTSDTPYTFPCPLAEDILPCVCSVVKDGSVDINCSEVESKEQLARVFAAHFPFQDMRKLTIVNNQNLKTLRAGDLGPVTFREIEMTGGVLEEVQHKALSGSYFTLEKLKLNSNKISMFPFEVIPVFYYLTHFYIHGNNIQQFPELMSNSLQDLNIAQNPIKSIPADGFQNLPKIEYIHAYLIELEELLPGTFAGLPNLHSVNVDINHLQHIPAGAIQLETDGDTYVYIEKNNISSIAVNAITGLRGVLYMSNNQLTDLREDVFRPFFEAKADIHLRGNPLSCGCDLAWLITNQAYMNYIKDSAGCYDGVLLTDLDPNTYIDLC